MAQSEFNLLLTALFGSEPSGYIEVRAFRGSQIVQRFVETIVDAEEVVQSLSPDWEIYFGVNPRTQPGETKADETFRVQVVVADLDLKRFDGDAKQLEHAAELAGIPPTAVVESGGGLHLYWSLVEPVTDTQSFQNVRRRFLTQISSDAVHDAPRILRVPGTLNNKYDNERHVKLRELDTSRQYISTIFEKTPSVTEPVRRMLYTGDLAKHKSRSERDWALVSALAKTGFTDEEISLCFRASPAGVRYRERWPQLLQHDLQRVRDNMHEDPGEGYQIYTHESCFYVRSTKGDRQLSTFTFSPEALLQSVDDDEDSIVGSIRAQGTTHTWKDVSFPRRAFVDKRALARCLPVAAWSWLGTDNDVVRLLPHLMTTIQEKNIPILRAVKTLGRYGTAWLTNTGVITPTAVRSFAESGYTYQDPKRESPILNYKSIDAAVYTQLVQQIYQLLPKINNPSVIWPIIGWYFVTPFKPVLGQGGREFPLLMIAGTRGAGKTATIRVIMLPLFGWSEPRTYNCATTDFVTLAILSSTTSVPVAFSEYRHDAQIVERFTRRLRLAYDTGVDLRGRPDQTTVSYPLTAPISIDGEDAIDDPAIQERSVVVRMHPEELGDEHREAFYDLAELDLNAFALPYIQSTLSHDPPFEQAYKLIGEAFSEKLPDRIITNLAKVTTGLLEYVAFGRRFDAEVPDITPDFLRDVVFVHSLENILLGETSRTRAAVDNFVEDAVNHVYRTKLGMRVGSGILGLDPFIWRYEEHSSELCVHLSTSYSWWLGYRRRLGASSASSASLKAQLRERSMGGHVGQYIKGTRSIATGAGKSVLSYVIDLEAAAAAGLDVPAALNLATVALPSQPKDKVIRIGRPT